jgi:hypothetical protein
VHRRWIALPFLAAALLVGGGRSVPVRAEARFRPPPVVIAIVEVGDGLNVLHSDFGLPPGQRRPPKVVGMPPTQAIDLPVGGSFEGRLQAARRTFGKLTPGELYSVPGTRIIGIYAEHEAKDQYSILEDRDHGTATSSSAVGLTHGTAPHALLVFVPDTGREAWEWVAEQEWIDVVSSSYVTVLSDGNCPEIESVRKIAARGSMIFTAAGNQDPGWTTGSPSGLPEEYQVGGVDADGRTYLPPGRTDVNDPVSLTNTSTRPYETGDGFDRMVADPAALKGHVSSSGTSLAAPATAGRAATLIAHAREVLHTPAKWDRKYLAVLGAGGTRPARGPLADGNLTSAELTDVLHHTAQPYEPPAPFRYLLEGYGAHTDETTDFAIEVLNGTAEAPERPEEDAMHAEVEAARAHFFPEDRCS